MLEYLKIVSYVSSTFDFFIGFSMSILALRIKKKLESKSNMSLSKISKWILNMVAINMTLLSIIYPPITVLYTNKIIEKYKNSEE